MNKLDKARRIAVNVAKLPASVLTLPTRLGLLTLILAVLIVMAVPALLWLVDTDVEKFSIPVTFVDGNELFSRCDGFREKDLSPNEAVRFQYCHAYVVAVADSLAMFKAASDGTGSGSLSEVRVRAYCPSKETNSFEVTIVAIDYLRDHPEKRDEAASSLVANALVKAFPCN